MGCASSKVRGSELAADKGSAGFSKSISIPSHPQEMPDDFHIVALTSSTYGILKVDAPKLPAEDSKDGMGAHSVKDVLNKLNNLENKAEAAPQSWLEVSSMLENLKPNLEKPAVTKPAAKKPQQLDSIDINDMMLDLDEETGLVRPKARKLANLRKTGKTLPIHTLEELDKRFGGKENSVKNTDIASTALSIADIRASLKPVKASKSSATKDVTTSKALESLHHVQKSAADAPVREEVVLKAATCIPDAVIRKDSELIDDDFLGAYKSAFDTLSDDDWKTVEALYQESQDESEQGCGDGNHGIAVVNSNTEMEMEEESFSVQTISSSGDDIRVKEVVASTESSTIQDCPSELAMAAKSKRAAGRQTLLEEHEELCPPGGKQAVVLYTTSLRGIRKTYEDCAKAREILQSYGVLIDERDVSMHLEYRNELRELMQRVVTVPRLFITGRYIGGADAISKLAEEGKLAGLLEGSSRIHGGGEGAACCDGCGGAKFVPCLDCSGSRKVVNERKQVMKCLDCNENGLIQCPLCT